MQPTSKSKLAASMTWESPFEEIWLGISAKHRRPSVLDAVEKGFRVSNLELDRTLPAISVTVIDTRDSGVRT